VRVKKLTPIALLQNEISQLRDDNLKLNQTIAVQSRELILLNRIAQGPPTIMIACEKIVDAAAQQVTTMLQFVKEVRRR
jgi:hypothetical protein